MVVGMAAANPLGQPQVLARHRKRFENGVSRRMRRGPGQTIFNIADACDAALRGANPADYLRSREASCRATNASRGGFAATTWEVWCLGAMPTA